MQLDKKTAVITGGSGGIGSAIARAFVREGAGIVINSRTGPALEKVKEEILAVNSNARVDIFPTDVSKEDNARELIDYVVSKFGTVDILVNCAGIMGPIGLSGEVDSSEWIEALQINLCGTFFCIRSVLPVMMKNKKGKIVNFSGGGAVSPRPRFSAYGTSKAAVVRLTETFAHEVSENNIEINAIAPGAVNTKLLEAVLIAGEAAGPELEKARKQKKNGGTPPEKAAELAVFLASSKSDGMTGRLISAVWDNWQDIPQHLDDIMSSDIFTMRRIIPEDKGYDW